MLKDLPTIKAFPQIRSYQDNIFRSNLTYDLNYNIETAASNYEQCRTQMRSLLKDCFTNLDDFPNLYFTSGVTSALDIILQKHLVQAEKNEYRYIFAYNTVTDSPKEYRYQSWPNSASGKFLPIYKDQKIILDCSYLFATSMNHDKIIPDNVEYLCIGVSKSHNLSDVRFGCVFSKQPIRGIHTLQYDYGYGNSIIKSVIDRISEYPLNHLYNLNKENLENLYSSYDLKINDTNLFGMDNNGMRYPYYLLK